MAVTDLSINRPLYTYSNFVDYDQRVTVKWPKAPPASLPILAYRLRAENSQPQLVPDSRESVRASASSVGDLNSTTNIEGSFVIAGTVYAMSQKLCESVKLHISATAD